MSTWVVSFRSLVSPVMLVLAAALLFAAAARELLVWYAGSLAHTGTPESLNAALSYTPGDPSKWKQLGLASLEKDPSASVAAFGHATRLNPVDADSLVGLAIHAEAAGDIIRAESLYRRAAACSRRFKPQFALAAFYARTGKIQQFLRTAQVAAAIDKANLARIFKLAREAGVDPDAIPLELDLRTRHSLTAYLEFAIGEDRPIALARAALRLAEVSPNEPILLNVCDRLILLGAGDAAVALWNKVSRFEELDPGRGRSLTNASFSLSHPTAAGGFNWRLYTNAGIELRPSGAGLAIDFSGDQKEHALILEQFVPVLAGRRYKASARSESLEAGTTEGLSWLMQCMPSRQPIASFDYSPSDLPATMTFPVPESCELASILLVYNRRPGTTRIQGSLHLKSVGLELLP